MEHVADAQFDTAQETDAAAPLEAAEAVDIMLSLLSDGLDHPELWPIMNQFVDGVPSLVSELQRRLAIESFSPAKTSLQILLAMCGAVVDDAAKMLELLQPIAIQNSQSPLVQGAVFYLEGLCRPEDPRYQLQGKICPAPFVQLDVLERSTHQCCASWLGTSAGDLSCNDWQDVWNSETAQAIRGSVLDGTYRYCNKGACPKIQANDLSPRAELAASSAFWADILDRDATAVPAGPEIVNLAYDRTCNLACPSCRRERYAADDAERARFDDMQERAILPLLKNAKRVFVTGSGDPFASKNFRRLMEQLTAEDYPDLRFQIMTNGMLFTPAQWERFPALHGRTAILKVSIDAATGPTHELLRRGARWPVMLENMAFAGRLTAQGLVDHFELVFTVQRENYREMGDAVSLAKEVGATGVYFARITNWGTFTHAEYADKAVFVPSHTEHDAFLDAMQDPRLLDPMVLLGDLSPFVRTHAEGERRKFTS